MLTMLPNTTGNHEFRGYRATLEAAIDAVTACAIMLAAEYRVIYSWKDQIGDFFSFVKSPKWTPTQRYTFRPDGGGWQSIQFTWSRAWSI